MSRASYMNALDIILKIITYGNSLRTGIRCREHKISLAHILDGYNDPWRERKSPWNI